MDSQKEWEYIKELPIDKLAERGGLSLIAVRSAIDLSCFSKNKFVPSNEFSKLARILKKTLEPKDYLKGKREIDNYLFTGQFLERTMKHYQKEYQKKHDEEPPYKITIKDPNTAKISEFVNELAPVIFQIAEDLSDLSKLSKGRLEALTEFSLALSEVSSLYEGPLKQYAAA